MSTQPKALRLADALRDGTYLLFVERDATEAELRRLHQHELALNEWLEKTHWVQVGADPKELGRHRADVIKDRIDRLQTMNQVLLAQRDELLAVVHKARALIGDQRLRVEPHKDGFKLAQDPMPAVRVLESIDAAIVQAGAAPAIQHLPADDTEGGAA